MGSSALPRRVAQLAYAATALAAAVFGYDFGVQIGGWWVGCLTALNSALFGWLITGAAVEVVVRLTTRLRGSA
jgi:hypothetical protein